MPDSMDGLEFFDFAAQKCRGFSRHLLPVFRMQQAQH